jgi:group II intron reverse transcriptase/maturase
MMKTQLDQIAKKAKLDPKVRFTSLAHLLTPEFLTETWGMMNRSAASGIDGQTARQFERDVEQQVAEIHKQLKAGRYRAPPVRRVEIPKGPGKAGTRPLGIPTVADRLLQRAVARILEAVFEADFLDCSYGFRPGRNPHHALQALRLHIVTKKVSYVHEADIRSYFTRIDHRWLYKMVAHRIADPAILRLIAKWLKAGVMQDGAFIDAKEGVPQGGPISPVLSNLYLHFTLDLWFAKKIKPQARGEAYLVRFADDFVGCFQYREDADRYQRQLRERFARFNLELAEDKTRLLAFGRFAAPPHGDWRAKRPETFEFLGFSVLQRRRKGGDKKSRKAA